MQLDLKRLACTRFRVNVIAHAFDRGCGLNRVQSCHSREYPSRDKSAGKIPPGKTPAGKTPRLTSGTATKATTCTCIFLVYRVIVLMQVKPNDGGVVSTELKTRISHGLLDRMPVGNYWEAPPVHACCLPHWRTGSK